MRKQKGFTLVELLTVISIIVLLMAITLPIFSSIRRKARAAVCTSNLRQWGMVYKMYTDEFDGKLPRDYDDAPWYYPIKNYYSDERKILLCPAAKKPTAQNKLLKKSKYGSTFAAWEFFSPSPEEAAWNSIGSYGLNGWTYKPERKEIYQSTTDDSESDGSENSGGSSGSSVSSRSWLIDYWNKRFGRYPDSGGSNSSSDSNSINDPYADSIADINEISNTSKYWLMAYENRANDIPIVFDSSWLYSYFDDQSAPPASDNLSTKYSGRSNTTCINRHDGGINIVFMDFSARKVGLKELWTLKWNKQFDTTGEWTKEGGVLPDKWPKWMRKYKDY